jgi:hypothetical protein
MHINTMLPAHNAKVLGSDRRFLTVIVALWPALVAPPQRVAVIELA